MKSLISPQTSISSLKEDLEPQNLVKIADYSKVWYYYKNCKYRLLDVNNWNNNNKFKDTAKFQVYDAKGYDVYRTVETGDYIQIFYSELTSSDKNKWLKVEGVNSLNEFDGSAESLTITLREAEDPTCLENKELVRNLLRCKLSIRRSSNVISTDVSLAHGIYEDIYNLLKPSTSWLASFQWKTLLQNLITTP